MTINILIVGNSMLRLPIDNSWNIIQEALNKFEANFELECAEHGGQIREDTL